MCLGPERPQRGVHPGITRHPRPSPRRDALDARRPACDHVLSNIVDPDVLCVEDHGVITSAGTAAGIDAAVHIVRKELGASAANVVAHQMVAPPQCDDGQAQCIEAPLSENCADSSAEVAEWIPQNLGEDLPIEQLARRAIMSPRTFARRFRANMGKTPAAWLNRERIIRAQQLLEQTELSLETVAADTGFGAVAVMRHHFVKVLQTTPMAYRRAFCQRVSA